MRAEHEQKRAGRAFEKVCLSHVTRRRLEREEGERGAGDGSTTQNKGRALERTDM